MIEALFVVLMQAAAGPPAEVPQTPAATEQTQEAAAETAEASQVAERNRRRCRVDNITGSRLGARVCNSDAEREGLEREGRAFLEDAMRMWDNQSQ